jgi:hypothetical protein
VILQGIRVVALVVVSAILGAGAAFLLAQRDRDSYARQTQRQLEKQSGALRSLEQQLAASRVASRVDRSAPAAPPPRTAAEATELRAEVARAVREALDERFEPDGLPRAEEAKPAVPTEANWAAYRSSEQLLNAALSAKVWSEADNTAFRRSLSKVTFEQRLELIRRLSKAVNHDQVVVQGRVL